MRHRSFFILVVCTLLGSLAIFFLILFNVNTTNSLKQGTPSPTWVIQKQLKIPHSVFYAGFLNDQYGVTVGYYGATYWTSDGGQSWKQGVNEANCRFGLDILDEDYLWTVGNYGGNRISINGGASLFPATDLPLIEDRPNNLVNIIDRETIWLASPLRLALTKDAGFSWTDATLPVDCTYIAGIDFTSIASGYLIDIAGKLYKTIDGGNSWSNISQMPIVDGIRPTEEPSFAMRFSNDGKGTVVYLDKNDALYSFQVNLSASDKSHIWIPIPLPDLKNSSPYLSRDHQWLTLVDVMGNITALQLSTAGD